MTRSRVVEEGVGEQGAKTEKKCEQSSGQVMISGRNCDSYRSPSALRQDFVAAHCHRSSVFTPDKY